jgi:hypothetical protein
MTHSFLSILKNTKSIIIILSAFLIFVGLSGCSKKIYFASSEVVPAASGTVKIKKDNNNNYALEIDVISLAEPKDLPIAKQAYVVWMDTERNGENNLGELKSSSGLFSSTRKAALNTVTPFKPTNIFITAENAVNIESPQGQVVLKTNPF